MKKLTGVMMIFGVALSACAPMQGMKPIVYRGESSAILATAAQLCPTIQPTAANNYFSVKTITPTTLVCSADSTTIFNIFGKNSPVTLTVTALQNGDSTSVAVSEDLGSPTATNFTARDAILQALDAKFARVP